MSIGFPTNTVALIIVTMIGAGALTWFGLSSGLARLSLAPHVKNAWRWGAAVLLIAWLAGRLALAISPPSGPAVATQFRTTLAFLALGLLAGILPLLISPIYRQIVRAIPATSLVGVHVIRLAGVLFVALADMKLLPAQFALSAGYGDMTVGLLALGVVYLLARRKPHAHILAIAWNVLGLLDFAVALTTGAIYIAPFSAQVAASATSLLYLNYVLLIPAFGVPLYALLHIYSLFQMLSGRAPVSQSDEATSVRAPVILGERTVRP